MRKGWLYYSLIIGIASMLIAFTILALANAVYSGQSQMLDQLSKDGSLANITIDMYTLTNSPFFLTAIAILLLELLSGMLSYLFTRSDNGKADNWYVASIIAGLLPALVYGFFRLNTWLISMSQYESHSNVRPMEPAPPFIVIGLLGFEIAICLGISIAGGWLAKAALRRESNHPGP